MHNKLIIKAVYFAAMKHSNQRRKDKDISPYINHPISVAKILSEIGGIDDPEVLAAAGPKKGTDKHEASKRLLEIFWIGQKHDCSLDNNFFIQDIGILSLDELNIIAKKTLGDT